MSSVSSRAGTSVPRIGLASGVGTALEFYDFALYGTATALVFNQIFFVNDDPWFGTFIGLATFAIGFLVAPLGALLFGWVGDRYGRRTSLVITFMAMGAATLLMGMLPSALTIGIAAPILLVCLRVVHGISRGGEVGGAAVLNAEHAPPLHRARWGSFVALGSPAGQLLANVAFALVLLLPMKDVIGWAWRLPFLFGGIVLVLGLWARRGVAETPVFSEMSNDIGADGPIRRGRLGETLMKNWRRIALCAGVNLGLNANMFILATFMLSYATADAPQGLGLARGSVVNGSIIGLLVHAAAVIIACILSDRVGRRPVMISGTIGCLAYAFFMFRLADQGTAVSVALAMGIGFFLTGFLFGPLMTYFTELFTPEARQSGVGLGYQIGVVLGGGLSPMIANRLVAATGTSASVAFYLAAVLTISLVCLLLLPETAPARTGRTGNESVTGEQDNLHEQPAVSLTPEEQT